MTIPTGLLVAIAAFNITMCILMWVGLDLFWTIARNTEKILKAIESASINVAVRRGGDSLRTRVDRARRGPL